jgi:tetratricopeptide (TPR) repeat protein
MKCPICGYKFNKGSICPSCRENAAIRARAYNISVRLYNKGLEQAKSKDLTGAVESLKRSVLFDKSNINARNVLGLVYYELGHMADALVQWIVSQNIKSEKNYAVDYLRIYGENIRSCEKMEDSVSLYNEALEYVKQKNDDLAIIRLKKALEINGKFVDALNLLSLCYLMRGRNNDALDIVNTVLRIDVNNPIALGYYRQICPDKSRPDHRALNKNEMRYATYYMPPDSGRNKKVGKPLHPVIMFAVGCLCTVIVMAVLVVPSITEGYKSDYEELSESNAKLKQEYDDLTLKTNDTADKLTAENKELQAQLDNINVKEFNERVAKLDDIKAMYDGGQVTQAAQQLIVLSTDGFSNDTLNKYNSYRQEILPAASSEYYKLGQEAEKAGKTDEAKANYNNCLNCALSDTEVKYDAMLRLGIIAQEAGDTNGAKDYFQKVVDNHPSRKAKTEAQKRYDEIVGASST